MEKFTQAPRREIGFLLKNYKAMKKNLLTYSLAFLVLLFLFFGWLFYQERRRSAQLEINVKNAKTNYETAQKNLSDVRTNRDRAGLNRRSRDSIVKEFAKGVPPINR